MRYRQNILIIENSTAVTGALNSILRSSASMKDRYNFTFILPAGSAGRAAVEAQGFSVYELPMREIRKHPVALLLYLPYLLYNTARLFTLVEKLKIDLINVNDFYNLLPAVYKMFGGTVPYVCYVRFLPSKFPQALVKLWCGMHRRYAASIIAVSEAVKKELPFQEKVEVIYNELPSLDVPYTPLTSTYILYPANYIRGKGQEFALESFAALHHRYPAWKLRFVGGDMGLQKNKEFKESLMKRAEELKIQDKVEWHSFTKEIGREYQHASLVLNFSESESFSLTCLEAMFYGRPVVATRCGGPAEIIDDKETGMLVPLGDTAAMTQAISSLLESPAEREALSQRAYLRVRQKFNAPNTTQRLGALYDRILFAG